MHSSLLAQSSCSSRRSGRSKLLCPTTPALLHLYVLLLQSSACTYMALQRRYICTWDRKLEKKKAIKRLRTDDNDSASTSSGSQSGASATPSEPVYGEKDIWSYIDDMFATQRAECMKNSDQTREDYINIMRK